MIRCREPHDPRAFKAPNREYTPQDREKIERTTRSPSYVTAEGGGGAKSGVEDKLIRDVQTARKQEARARATALKGEPSSLCRSLSRKGKRSRKGNRLPASFRQHSGVEAVLRGRRVSERQDSRRRPLLRSSARNRNEGSFPRSDAFI